MSRTYTITLEIEVKMTSPGYPATGPSYSSGGEPAEGPEFEIDTIAFEGDKETVGQLYQKLKDANGPYAQRPSYDQFFANLIYDKVLDKAYGEVWDWKDEQPED